MFLLFVARCDLRSTGLQGLGVFFGAFRMVFVLVHLPGHPKGMLFGVFLLHKTNQKAVSFGCLGTSLIHRCTQFTPFGT